MFVLLNEIADERQQQGFMLPGMSVLAHGWALPFHTSVSSVKTLWNCQEVPYQLLVLSVVTSSVQLNAGIVHPGSLQGQSNVLFLKHVQSYCWHPYGSS
jgi:hypothetical protein